MIATIPEIEALFDLPQAPPEWHKIAACMCLTCRKAARAVPEVGPPETRNGWPLDVRAGVADPGFTLNQPLAIPPAAESLIGLADPNFKPEPLYSLGDPEE